MVAVPLCIRDYARFHKFLQVNLFTRSSGENIMLKKLAFVAILVVVLAVAYGAAAALDVEGNTIQHGYDDSLACDPDGVEVLGYLYDADLMPPTGMTVQSVRIGGIHEDCAGEEMFVSLWNGTTYLAKGNAVIPDPVPSSLQIAVNPKPAIEDVTRLDVFIEPGP
jgi:hypothetical protein